MQYWARTYIDNKRVREYTYDAGTSVCTDTGTALREALVDIARELDIERPIVTTKHIREAINFRRVVFLPQDFIDGADFERLVIEIFDDGAVT